MVVLGIERWGEWKGNLLEAYSAVILHEERNQSVTDATIIDNTPLSDPNKVAELKSRLGDIDEELLLEFLGVASLSEYAGTVEDAYNRVQEATKESEVAVNIRSVSPSPPKVMNPLDRAPE